MQDAVADVIRERAALGRGRSGSIAVSAGAHAALILGAIFYANAVPEAPRQRAIVIRLAGITAPPPVQTAPVRATAAPPKKAPPPPSTPAPVIAEPPPVTPPKPPKKTSNGETLFGKSELPPSPKHQPAPSATPPQATPAQGNLPPLPAVGKAGVTSLEGGPFPYNAYIDRMVSLVGTHWFRPERGSETVSGLYFVIDRSGTVRDVRIERSSGDPAFDRAAQRAVLEASPLPPLPLAYDGTYLGVHLTFH